MYHVAWKAAFLGGPEQRALLQKQLGPGLGEDVVDAHVD